MSQIAAAAVAASGVAKPGSCHLFRHTMATLMLDGGADIRYVQAMPGHARLDTTQIYANPRELHQAGEETAGQQVTAMSE